jgi:mRNA-degrading endonuclease toxin of MazEF toxin-antitoxin module
MKRGDVAMVDWPFRDRTGSKVRPAVIVKADFPRGLIDGTVLAQFTSSRFWIPGTQVLLDPAHAMQSGLTKDCVADGRRPDPH